MNCFQEYDVNIHGDDDNNRNSNNSDNDDDNNIQYLLSSFLSSYFHKPI